MKLLKWMILLCASVLLAGCGTSRQAVGLEYCQIAESIYWTDSKELGATPTPIVGQIVRENEKRERLCGK